ncbi:MAG: amino acid racemase [Holosporaceae bacterium]|jgi:aspartate racemase|nr:amino acid racemase [Holosporaceae bacterium]
MGNVVGVIGGAGVAATNKLLELIEKNGVMNGAYRDSHHPEMVVYQATKAPSRSMFLEGNGASFVEDYIVISEKLKSAGATMLCMCCNTAHYAIDEIQKAIGLPFINLIKEVALEVAKKKVKSVGLVASEGCLKAKLYENAFLNDEIHIVYPDNAMQKEVTRGICNIKNEKRFYPEQSEERPKNIFEKVKAHLISKGADVVVVGCTDVRVDFESSETIDSLEILAGKIVELS